MKGHVLIYEKLLGRFGDLYWWPAETRDEILIGSILTQNTSWKNVEKAIAQLKADNLISLERIAEAKEED
ncbi:HhH-GPD family protein, partial [mine drainage metagenome]